MTPREIDVKLAEAMGYTFPYPEIGVRDDGDTYRVTIDGKPVATYGHHEYARLKAEAAAKAMRWEYVHPLAPVRYYSAPTWETSGQLIEWFGTLDVDESSLRRRRRFDERLGTQFWPSSLTPQRIAEAACVALGIEVPTESAAV